jgi:hypothetical protein
MKVETDIIVSKVASPILVIMYFNKSFDFTECDIVRINRLTLILQNYRSELRQIQYDVTDKNNNVNF